MPQGYSVDQLAGAIKQAAPGAYDHLDNSTLVGAVLKGYPQYQTQLSTEALQGMVNPPAPSQESGAWNAVKTLGKGLLEFGKDVADPRVPLVEGKQSLLQKDLLSPLSEQQKQADALKAAGRPVEAAAHQAASYIPFLGPIAAQAGEAFGRKDIGGGLVYGAAAVLGGKEAAEEGLRTSKTPPPMAPERPADVTTAAPRPAPSETGKTVQPSAKVPEITPTAPAKAIPGVPRGPLEAAGLIKPTLETSAKPITLPDQQAKFTAMATEAAQPEVLSARRAELEASANRLGPEFAEDSYKHEVARLEKVVRDAPDEVQDGTNIRSAAIRQLEDTKQQLANHLAVTKPQPLEASEPVPKTPTKNFDLESVLRQRVTDPTGAGRSEALQGKVREAIALPKQQALQVAGQMDEAGRRASVQAGIIRSVLDRQDEVSQVRAKLGAWSSERQVQIDEDTGLPIKGSQDIKFQNQATPAERDVYNRLLGRKLSEARARDEETGRVVQTPKVNSPEEQAQVDEFVKSLSAERDDIVGRVRGGMPVSDETIAHASDLTDQINQLSGWRQRAAAGVKGVRGVAGKAKPVEVEPGVWGPDPSAPLPELTQELYNKLMGRAVGKESASGKLWSQRIKPELLEKRISQLNEEARLRDTISRAIRSSHGDTSVSERAPVQPVEVKEAAPRVKTRSAKETYQAQSKQLSDNIEFAKNPPAQPAPELPVKPPDEPGYFTAKVLDENGQQTGWKKVKLSGPGTPGAAQGSDQGSPISQLTDTLNARIPPKTGILEKLKSANTLGLALEDGRSAINDAFTHAKAVAAGYAHSFMNPPEWNDFKANAGRWTKSLEVMQDSRRKFQAAISKAHPDPLAQIGIRNFMSANGDTDLLTQWRDASSGALRKGYDRALKLNEEEKLTAYHTRGFFDDMWQQMHQEGILEHFIQNYMPGMWKRDAAEGAAGRVLNSYRTDALRPNPSFARQKFYANDFEGEQAGKIPLDKRVGFAVDRYYTEATQALASRAYIRGLHEGAAADGNPIVAYAKGTGRILKASDEHPDPAYVINARGKADAIAADGRPYRFLNHPALQRYVYATSDVEGNPIMVKADALIHPDHFEMLKNQLDKSSWLKSTGLGRAVLKSSLALKHVELAFSAFHQGQLELHAMFHGVNPLTVKPFDVTDPITNELLDHSMTGRGPEGQAMWDEGNTSGGLIKYVPGVGPMYLKYSDWLFNERIPALKQAMAHKAFADNLARYSETMSRDQIAEISARQANAAFGGQNMLYLGRSQGIRDMFRLLTFAPDFLESRAKFVGQALKPSGREQAIALMRGTIGLYGVARVANMAANNGDPHYDKPFGVVMGGRVYQMRSLPGDVLNLVDDPRSFASARVNPFVVKPAIEALTGRDDLGRRVSLSDQAGDLAKTALPIPGQKLLEGDHSGILDAALQMIGVQSSIYRTPGVSKARELFFAREPAAARGSGNKALRDIEDAVARQSPATDKIIDDALAKGLVSTDQVNAALDTGSKPDIQRYASRLSLPEIAQVWKAAKGSERDDLAEIVEKKRSEFEANADNLPEKIRAADEAALEELLK